jgi:hypothetical protein
MDDGTRFNIMAMIGLHGTLKEIRLVRNTFFG